MITRPPPVRPAVTMMPQSVDCHRSDHLMCEPTCCTCVAALSNVVVNTMCWHGVIEADATVQVDAGCSIDIPYLGPDRRSLRLLSMTHQWRPVTIQHITSQSSQSTRHDPRRRATIGVLLVTALISGCATSTPRSAPDALPFQPAPALSTGGSNIMPIRWWTALDDDALNGRIDRALAENFSLDEAWQRLREARAVARQAGAERAVTLNAVGDASISDGSDVDERTQLGLGLEASYELDLWGRIESAAEAERLRAAATAAEYQTAAISLSAEVALTWYELAAAQLQLELIESQLETNETVLDVLERRFAVGQSGSADVLRQRQLVEATREQVTIARARIDVLDHQLAVLEGRPPQQQPMRMSTPQLPAIPDTPATGMPADLLRRRPDVRSAFLQLRAADEDLAVAVSDQYPRIDLAASLSTVAENPSGLFDHWLASLAAQVTAPLLDGGQRRAEVERAEAVRRRQLAAYGQTVLQAFRDVEDALTQEAEQADRIRSLERQRSLAVTTYQQLRLQYLNGAADFIDVLTALREQQAIERTLLTARLNRVAFRIALYRALAGGFETPHEQRGNRPNVHTTDDAEGDGASG